MDPFNPSTNDGAPYPASTFARSALPSPQEGRPSVAAMPEGTRRHVAIVVAVFVVVAVVLFHWHFNRG